MDYEAQELRDDKIRQDAELEADQAKEIKELDCDA